MLWGNRVSSSIISGLNKKVHIRIADWHNCLFQGGRYPHVYVDRIYLRRNWDGKFENVPFW